jgi:Spy/CpxP family protein refolding chaperone
MRLTCTFTRAALVLALGLIPALAQQPERPPKPRMGQGAHARMTQRLKLTEAQEKAIQAIRAKHAEALKAKMQASQEAHKALREAMQKPETPVDQLKALHRTAADTRFEAMLVQREMHQEIQAQLTPEQRAEAARMKGHRTGRKGLGCEGMGPGGLGMPPCEQAPGCVAPDKAPAK